MKINRLKAKRLFNNYRQKFYQNLKSEVKKIVPSVKKCYLIIDKNIPKKFLIKIKKTLKKYKIYIFF